MIISVALLPFRLTRIPQHFIRVLGSSCAQNHDNFRVIYKWPLIRHFRFIARLKTYQAGVMLISLPPLSYLHNSGVVTSVSLVHGCVAAGGAVMVLSVLSYAFSKIVGEIRYSETKKMLQVSHLSFFGNKSTILVNVEDIVPFDDLHHGKLQRLEFGNYLFYYSLKHGIVIDSEMLNKVLAVHP